MMDVQERVTIRIARIGEAGSDYEGAMAPASMGLEGDAFIRAEEPVRYRLHAELVSGQVVVRGELETELGLLCCACGDFFSTTTRVSSFLHAYAVESGVEKIDLTDDIREDILLQVPLYPSGPLDEHACCRICGRDRSEPVEKHSSETAPDVWNALNRLKL
jgi:uncharacterized metal-binding protein YceD (DUF177 family)